MFVCVLLQPVRPHAGLLRLLRTHLYLVHNARPQCFRLSGQHGMIFRSRISVSVVHSGSGGASGGWGGSYPSF